MARGKVVRRFDGPLTIKAPVQGAEFEEFAFKVLKQVLLSVPASLPTSVSRQVHPDTHISDRAMKRLNFILMQASPHACGVFPILNTSRTCDIPIGDGAAHG